MFGTLLVLSNTHILYNLVFFNIYKSLQQKQTTTKNKQINKQTNKQTKIRPNKQKVKKKKKHTNKAMIYVLYNKNDCSSFKQASSCLIHTIT